MQDGGEPYRRQIDTYLPSCPLRGLSTRLLCFVSLDTSEREGVASNQ
jgi:hypothetical protein